MPPLSDILEEQVVLPEFTARQADVLAAAFDVLVKGGERALTTAGVARAANCSKESLYKWFGDRDGLMSAMVSFQAMKVRTVVGDEADAMTFSAFRAHLVTFGRDLLSVLAGDTSLAMNRLAIGQASRAGGPLGQFVLERGRRIIGIRAGALIEAGRRRGFLAYDDRDRAFQTLYGLIVRDLHVRLLLGDRLLPGEEHFEAEAALAVDQFFRLYRPDDAKSADGARTPSAVPPKH